MDYQESLDYLYGLQQFGIKLGLDNIRSLLARLNHPERKFGILHVGGTNGKGSVSACLAEILKQAGCRVGLYTSPHLHSFTERIQVDGVRISEEEVASLTDEIHGACEGIPATFFEFTTALALLYFARKKVDFAVLEVGMGGRLDATNAVVPRLSVITPVCLDHAEHLGADIAAIAGEKGGVIKEGVPVVIGPQEPEALAVLQKQANIKQAPLYIYGRDFSPLPHADGFSFRGMGMALSHLQPGLSGAHQYDNMSVALAAARLLQMQGASVSESAMRLGVEKVSWPGRLEWWKGKRRILLDGAHNEGGARALASYLSTLKPGGIRWVAGIKGDKKVQDILAPVLPFVTQMYCTPVPVEKAVPAERIVSQSRAAGVAARAFDAPNDALAAALADQKENEIVLVAGSLFLVAAAREFLMCQE